MEEYSYSEPFKDSLLFGGAIGASVLLVVTLFFMVFYLHQSDIVNRQLVLVQRVASHGDRCQNVGAKRDSPPPPYSVSGEWDSLPVLHLLVKGGSVAGLDINGIKDSEISLLLESLISLRQAQENIQPETSAYSSLTLLFYEKVQILADALAFQLMTARNRVWVTFWLLVLWVTLLLTCVFFVSRLFQSRGRQLRLENRSLWFGKELLQALPVAYILLDKSLTLSFVNRLAEHFLKPLRGVQKERYWGYFCQDQSQLEELRDVLQDFSKDSLKNVFSGSQEVSLVQGGGRESLVVIQWYKLFLDGQYYLLGVLNDSEKGRREDLNLAIAQEHINELANNLFQAQDDERRHLADELHDGLCQSLAALKMQVFSVERHVEKVELQEECRSARQFIAQIIEDVRRLSHDLSPVILDDLGLSDALVHLVNNFTALNNLKASIAIPDLDEIFAGDTARNIYRIVQEAINNVGKHAKASLVLLEAEIVDDKVCFSIKDDGVGFDVSSTKKGRPGAGLGLASMAQRVQLMDGKFAIISSPGDGCEISFTLLKK